MSSTILHDFTVYWETPQTIQQVMKRLAVLDGQVTNSILNELIGDHAMTGDQQKDLYERYKQEAAGTPILTRKLANTDKVNNKIPHDFVGDIVDTKVGYMGNEIEISLDKKSYITDNELNEVLYTKDSELLRDFAIANYAADNNMELLKKAAICGLGCRLLYIDGEGNIRYVNVDPWECIFIYDRSIYEPQYALRYYSVEILRNGRAGKVEKETVWRVEWYDSVNVTFFIQTKEDGDFIPDMTEEGVDSNGMKPHMFSGLPLIAFPNNEELLSDVQKVIALVDGYDRTVSDVNSEIEQLRLAYMFLTGAGLEVDDPFMESLKQTGVFPLPEGGSAGFIEKNLNDAIIEHHLDRAERNIMRFAKSVDFGSEAFAGGMPVIAFQIKIAGLEHKCKITEAKFKRAYRRQYELITELWRTSKKGDISALDVQFSFTRNIPQNLAELATTLGTLKGLVSDKTALSQMSFIDDAQEEMDQIALEEELNPEVDLEEEDET